VTSTTAEPTDVTELLRRARAGDRAAETEVCTRLYGALRQAARRHVQRMSGLAPVGATELLHESLLALHWPAMPEFEDRGRFMAYAGRVMRNVLIDLIREQQAQQRGGGAVHEPLATLHGEQAAAEAARAEDEALAVDGALRQLEALEPRLARLVELRYFVGLGTAEVAQTLGVTERTVQRDWLKARALLRDWLRD
jgi:RNA polymerase sigma factor (TIGR02999 family)